MCRHGSKQVHGNVSSTFYDRKLSSLIQLEYRSVWRGNRKRNLETREGPRGKGLLGDRKPLKI